MGKASFQLERKVVGELTEISKTQENVFTIEASCKGRLCFKKNERKGQKSRNSLCSTGIISRKDWRKKVAGRQAASALSVNENSSLPRGLPKGFFSQSTLLACPPPLYSLSLSRRSEESDLVNLGNNWMCLALPTLAFWEHTCDVFLFFQGGFLAWEATVTNDCW